MTKLTVKASFEAKDIFTGERFPHFHKEEFDVVGETKEIAINNLYMLLDESAADIESQSGYKVIYEFTYTEETL